MSSAGKLSIPEALLKLRNTFGTNKTRSYEWRIRELQQLKKMLVENEKGFINALQKDLGRPIFECVGLELTPLVVELDHAIQHLYQWMKPDFVSGIMRSSPINIH
jgi:aldehyde dehydrogenase (NAD+)